MEGPPILALLHHPYEVAEVPADRLLAPSDAAAVMPDMSRSIQPSLPHTVALLMAHDRRRRMLSVLACSPPGELRISPGDRFPVDGSAIPLLAGDLRLAVCLDTRVCDGTLERRLADESLHGAVSTLVTTPLGGSYLLCLGMHASPVCDMDRLIRALHCASDYIRQTEYRSLASAEAGFAARPDPHVQPRSNARRGATSHPEGAV